MAMPKLSGISWSLTLLSSSFTIAGCLATATSSGGDAPFQGAAVVTKRIAEIDTQIMLANPCLNTEAAKTAKGTFEVTADGSGKLAGRTMLWHGEPTIESCVIAAIGKGVVSARPGPSVSTLISQAPHRWQQSGSVSKRMTAELTVATGSQWPVGG